MVVAQLRGAKFEVWFRNSKKIMGPIMEDVHIAYHALVDVAEACGFRNTTDYLNYLDNHGRKILERLK